MTKRATVAEQRHADRVADLGCWVCRVHLGVFTKCEIHHIKSGVVGIGRRSKLIIGLCPIHHRLGGHGVALHAGVKTWEARFGRQIDMVREIENELGVAA